MIKTRTLGWIGAVVIALGAGVAVVSHNATPTVTAGMCYMRQDGVIDQVNPSRAGRTEGLGGAHDVGIRGEDGKLYGLGSECTPNHTENRYQRPPMEAGVDARYLWDFYNDPSQNLELHRCQALPPGRDYKGKRYPPDPQLRCSFTSNGDPISKFGCLPAPRPLSGEFNPRLFVCGSQTPGPTMQPTGATTPSLTPCWGTSQGCVTPRPTGCPVCPTCPPSGQTPGRTVTFQTNRTPTPLPGPCVQRCPAGTPCGASGCWNHCTGEMGVPCQ